MGLLSNLKGLSSSILNLSSKTVSKISSPISSVAGKIDSLIPHPKNGGLQNVVDVLTAPFTGGKVVANVKNTTLKKGLELVSNNPFKTAAVGAGVVQAARIAIPAIAKSAGTVKKATGIISSPPAQAAKGGMLDSKPQTMNGSPQSAQGGIIKSTSSSPRRSSTKKRTTRKSTGKSRRQSRSRSRIKSKTKLRRKTKSKRGTAKQYARPGGKKVFYAKKTGQPFIRLANGQTRFIKGKRKRK
jgi:hypothetical protein